MPCETFQNALVEAAASGLQPQGELRAHLDACPACRTAFVQEQSLFSSIDSSLRAAVNAEIPASLLPRVRASIAEEPAVTRGWIPGWLAMAGAAAMLVALIAVLTVRRTSLGQLPATTASKASAPAPNVPPQKTQNPNPALPASTNFVSPVRTAGTHLPAPHNAMPEVLVPRDQEALLASYAEQWNQRMRAPLVAAKVFSPLQIAPIQIDQLDVKLMAEEQAQ
jgi:hypothetical protein